MLSVSLPWGRITAMPYTQKCMSASTQGCVVCVQRRAVGCSLLALFLLIKYRNRRMFVCVAVAVCMKQGSQFAAPVLLTQLHFMLGSVLREEREKKGSSGASWMLCVRLS